jgi:hypothetical protein
MGVGGHDVPGTGMAGEDTARLDANPRGESAGKQQQQQPGSARFGLVRFNSGGRSTTGTLFIHHRV